MGRVQHLLPAACELPPFSGKMLLLLWHHLKCLTESTATHTQAGRAPVLQIAARLYGHFVACLWQPIFSPLFENVYLLYLLLRL